MITEDCLCCNGTGICTDINGDKGSCLTCCGSGRFKYSLDDKIDYLHSIINKHADTITYLQKEKMAYRSALKEVCQDKEKYKELLNKHFEKFDV